MTPPRVEIYIPHRSGPFVVDGDHGPLFSNENHGLSVITAIGFDWNDHREVMVRGLVESASHGFVGLSAWVPGANSLNAAVERIIGPPHECGAFRFSCFTSSMEIFNAVFDLRDQYGKWASGEWCIGACDDPSALAHSPELMGPLGGLPDGFALANASAIRWSMCLLEQQESLVTIKLTPRTEPMVEELLGRLKTSLA